MEDYGLEVGDVAAPTAGGCAIVGRGEPVGEGAGGVDGAGAGAASAEPHEGMEFGSYDEAAAFYHGYARREGFRVSKKSSRRSKLDNCFVEVKFVCSRYGKKHEKPHALYRRRSGKVECRAAMFVRKREGSARWFVYYLVKEHNHELARQQRRIIPGSPGGLGAPAGDGGTRSAEDARHLFEFLTRMQEDNPGFFYALDLDDSERLRNVLWVDAKGRLDYLYATFGDAVFFHTARLRIKCGYKLPILTIGGVTNHGLTALFGCSLLADESASSFVWVMETWLGAVGGRPPRAITTDHCAAIMAAIKRVFPDSKHRFCIQNIRKKVFDDLGYVPLQHSDDFMHKFDKCVYVPVTSEEFEGRWSTMIAEFELRQHGYLQSLYEDRCYWVPAYLRDTYFGELPSSQGGSVDLYLSKPTTLKDFLEQYEVELQHHCEKECIEDFQSLHTGLQLESQSPYEMQVSQLYTRYAFKKFQAEVMATCACHVINKQEDGPVITFCVNDLEEGNEFMVAWNRTESRVFCSCCSFEFKGHLCRHAIVVLQLAGVPKIPSYYILKRWMRDARQFLTLSEKPSTVQSWFQRYNDLCNQAIRLAYECSASEESYHVSSIALEDAMAQCIKETTSSVRNSDPNHSTSDVFPSVIKKKKVLSRQ